MKQNTIARDIRAEEAEERRLEREAEIAEQRAEIEAEWRAEEAENEN